MNSNRASGVQDAFCRKVRGRSFFKRFEIAQKDAHTVGSNGRPKSFSVSNHSQNAGLAISLSDQLILLVHAAARFTQVAWTVVCAVAIDVVNGVFRESAVRNDPSDVMAEDLKAVSVVNRPIAIRFFRRSGSGARFYPARNPGVNFPANVPFGIKNKASLKFLDCQSTSFHYLHGVL